MAGPMLFAPTDGAPDASRATGLGLADVHLQQWRRRAGHRLPRRPPRPVRAGRRRHGGGRGDRGRAARPDLRARPRALGRRPGRAAAPDRGLPALARRGAGHPARPRRPTGRHATTLGRAVPHHPRAARGRLADRRAERRAVPRRPPGTERADHRRARRGDGRVGRGGRSRPGGGLRPGRDPRCARLPAALVPLAAVQPAHRRPRRLAGQPHALPARGGGRRPRGDR